ncbi:MAG: RDD family protein, partial [Chlamydiia bacterium]|nr:RDD family protein [Chlamydiia bacterium]
EENRANNQAPKSRPWMRFVGRMFDYSWFGLVLGWVLSAFGLTIEEAPFGLLLVPFLWIFGETFFMSTWGMTPGKWMTQTYVRLKDHRKLTMKDALYRSLSVWWLGLAAGIPIISFITMIVACVKLSNTGKTTWDRSGKFIVWHRRIGPFRLTFLAVFFLAFFWSIAPFVINVN